MFFSSKETTPSSLLPIHVTLYSLGKTVYFFLPTLFIGLIPFPGKDSGIPILIHEVKVDFTLSSQAFKSLKTPLKHN